MEGKPMTVVEGSDIDPNLVQELMGFCVEIKNRNSRTGVVPGVLVQGRAQPLVVSVLSNFNRDGLTVGANFDGVMKENLELVMEVMHINQFLDVVVFSVLSPMNRRLTPAIRQLNAWADIGQSCLLVGMSPQMGANGAVSYQWKITPGIISSTKLTDYNSLLFSGGSSIGDGGGPVFNLRTKELVGIMVATGNRPHAQFEAKCCCARSSPEGHVLPLWILKVFLGGGFFHVSGGPAFTDDGTIPAGPQDPLFERCPNLVNCSINAA